MRLFQQDYFIRSLVAFGGLKLDTITEWVSEREVRGNHVGLFSRSESLEITTHSWAVVIVSEGSGFYPPSAMAFGVPAQRMLWCELAVGEIRFGQWIKLDVGRFSGSRYCLTDSMIECVGFGIGTR